MWSVKRAAAGVVIAAGVVGVSGQFEHAAGGIATHEAESVALPAEGAAPGVFMPWSATEAPMSAAAVACERATIDVATFGGGGADIDAAMRAGVVLEVLPMGIVMPERADRREETRVNLAVDTRVDTLDAAARVETVAAYRVEAVVLADGAVVVRVRPVTVPAPGTCAAGTVLLAACAARRRRNR